MRRITRDAFLYLEPHALDATDFAQCSSCRDYAKQRMRCAILGNTLKVEDDDTCGAYIEGVYGGQPIQALVTPKSVGFLKHTQVRCEHCAYGGRECGLFKMLNATFPSTFALDTRIHPKGCCNAWTKPNQPAAGAESARAEPTAA